MSSDHPRCAPLGLAQEGLWLIEATRGKSDIYPYNEVVCFRLRGQLERGALTRALDRIVARHEIWRTSIQVVDGVPRQQVADAIEGSIEPLSWDPTDPPGLEPRLSAYARAEARSAFDLARGPLWRARLAQLGPDDHALLLTLHHLIFDGWSIGVFASELATLYQTFTAGGSDPLPPLALQYGEFAAWERRELTDAKLASSLSYWTDRLRGSPSQLDLPTDRPRPPVPSGHGGRIVRRLSPRIGEAIRALAEREHVTLFPLLLAAFQVLLARYSHQDDIVVGMAIATRTSARFRKLLGYFVNMIALRCDLSTDPTFRALLQQTRDDVLDAYRHGAVPFHRVVEALQPQRSSGRVLVQAAMALDTAPEPPRELAPSLSLEVRSLDAGTAKFDLALVAAHDGDELRLTADYDADLFEPSTVDGLLGCYENLLASIAAEPNRRVSELSLLAPEQRRQLLAESSSAASQPRSKSTIVERFDESARTNPDAVAVESEGQSLSYRELDERSAALAARLRGLGVGPEVRVGVCVERSPELVVALLGVLRAGGAYVPLDPDHPAERRRFMIEDSRARVVLTDADWPAIASAGPALPAAPVDPETTAYVIYTSGSTGRPKGVMITHRALANHMRWMQDHYPLAADDAVLQKTAISFDASVWEFWAPLLAGARLVMARPGGQRDPAYLVEAIERHRVTTLQVVPTLLAALVDEPGLSTTGLRRVFSGGEALTSALARRLLERVPVELVNLYGPTEVTIDATSWRWQPETGGRDVPIGRPIAGVRAYVLDARQELLPRGAIGELYLAGEGLGRGYVGQPALTAERFLPDPHSPVLGARMYRTGDRVRYRRDGCLEFLGRVDRQIKLRGVRIELGEIEIALAAHPGVREAAVVAAGADSGPPRLVAYLAPRGATAPSADELGEFLRARLPEAMVPVRFIELAALPQLPSGKIDRSALPDPDLDASPSVAPQSAVERIVADVFAQVLGVETVGADDHFFELGGHSLLAMQAAVRIAEALGIEVPLFALLEAPRVRELAAQLEQADAGSAHATAIERVERRPRMAASFAQRRLWFADQLVPNNPFYNQANVMQIDGPLDEFAIAAAVDALVQRHEALRTRFVEDGGEPCQVIEDRADVWWGVKQVDEAEAARLAAEEAERPFDLETGPVIRAGLLRLSAERRWLLLTNHHIVGDGWSTGLLFEELGALYGALAEGRESPLPPLEVQYADFAEWQRQQLRGPALDGLIRYWTDQLAGYEPLALQTDRPRPPQPSHRGGSVELDFGPELFDGLRRLARREDATLYMVLLAAFVALLARQTRQQDILIGTGNASRNHSALERLIGFFVNLLPMRVRLDGANTFDEVLQRVKQTVLGALAHQDLPFDKLVETLRPPREPGEHPLFGVALTLQNAAGNGPSFPGVTTTLVQSEDFRTRLDLELHVWEDAGTLKCTCVYSSELFDRQTIARLADRYHRLCREIVR